MESILQKDKTVCIICKQNASGDHLDKHHCFGAAFRKKSEKFGLTVYIHHNKCHIFGKNAVHNNAQVNRHLQAFAQKKAMDHYKWSVDDFIKEFGRNYLNGNQD